MKKEDKKVLNGYGVLFALYVAECSNKNPTVIIDLFNDCEELANNCSYKTYHQIKSEKPIIYND